MEKTIAATEKISVLLDKSFQRMKKDHPQFSLRALAKKMDVNPSYLSKVMRGLKPLSVALIPKFKKGLNLDNIEVQSLQRLVLEGFEDKHLLDKTGLKSLQATTGTAANYKSLSKKDFVLLEEWFYIPLMNLTTLPSFESDPEWIAQRLGISVRDSKSAIKTLLRSGYLILKDDRLILSSLKARFPTDRSHESVRKHHVAMMKKAEQVLTKKTAQEDFDLRLINGISFAGDSKKLQQAQAILNKAIYEAAELMASGEPDQVFQLNIQLFKTTN